MTKMADYKIEHWTDAVAEANYKNGGAIEITVNDRAATRRAIINRVRQYKMEFVERSDWAAHKNRSEKMSDDWSYSKIAIHHAGRSFSCGPAALQMKNIQVQQMSSISADDIGYHYAIDCYGNVYEGRDIRFKGESVKNHNTGVIGIVLLENLAEPSEGNDRVSKVKSFFNAIGYSQQPSIPESQRESAKKFIAVLQEFFNIRILGGHREFPEQIHEGKICPGNVGIDFVQELRKENGLAMP